MVQDSLFEKKLSQKQRILRILREANGKPVDGQIVFLHGMYISQYHARILELQRAGYDIRPVDIAGKNWKSYKLVE